MDKISRKKAKSKESKSKILSGSIQNKAASKESNETDSNKNEIFSNHISFVKRIREWYNIILKAVPTLINLVLLIIAIRQTNIANKSAEAAFISADAAKNSVELSEKSFRIENRAYVVIKQWNLTYPYSDTTRESWIEFENIGNTPAKNLKILFALGCDTGLTLEGINEKIANSQIQFVSKRDLGPDSPTQQKFPPVRNDPNMHAKIKDGTFRMYAFANITYFDIFNEEHFTHFCCVWNEKTKMAEILPFYNDSN